MKHYVVAGVNVTDDSWVGDYVTEVTKLVESHGGKYLARTPNTERIEGAQDLPGLIVLIEFPSKEAAHEFYGSDEYKPYLEKRKAGATSHLVLIPGEDIAAQ